MKSLSRSLETSQNVSFLSCIFPVVWEEFILTVYIIKDMSKHGGTLKISLITFSHMGSRNLLNLFLEVWKLAQMNCVTRVTRQEFKKIVYLAKKVQKWLEFKDFVNYI